MSYPWSNKNNLPNLQVCGENEVLLFEVGGEKAEVRLQDGEKLLKDVVFDITGTLGISDFTARKYIKEMEKDGKILVRIEKNGMIEKKYISLPNVRVSQMSFTDEKTIFSP